MDDAVPADGSDDARALGREMLGGLMVVSGRVDLQAVSQRYLNKGFTAGI